MAAQELNKIDKMKIIVPMAGMGKRMRPHTLTVPKPLIPIAGKPIVKRLVEDIAKVCDEKIDEQLFLSWSMKLAPFENLEWSNQDFNSGNFLEITREEALNVFIRLNEYTRR